jgi:MoaA/NifB/PqqE/SkfB family radical SAM enzyme
MINDNNKESWCVNAYMNFSVAPSGVVKPCCMSKKKYVTDNGSQFLKDASILEFWNSNDRKSFINDLENGNKIPDCKNCWDEEAAGKNSKRLRDNEIYQNNNLSADMLPLVADLSLGNVCNLKCRICSPYHSSVWVLEEERLGNASTPEHVRAVTFGQAGKDSFSSKNDLFWNDIYKLLTNATKLDFAGGEPFYVDRHWEIIKALVDNKSSLTQHVHYNTNGTIFPEKHIHLLEQFKVVDIQISSDGVGRKFEYMRHPAVWSEVETNIDRFIQAKNTSNTKWLVGVCLSVSAFNVYDFFETFEHYAAKGMSIYVNTVNDRRGLAILPPEVKTVVIDKLKRDQSVYNNKQWQVERDMICRYLENTTYDSDTWKEFCDEVHLRDQIRKESFENTFEEYFQKIKEFMV